MITVRLSLHANQNFSHEKLLSMTYLLLFRGINHQRRLCYKKSEKSEKHKISPRADHAHQTNKIGWKLVSLAFLENRHRKTYSYPISSPWVPPLTIFASNNQVLGRKNKASVDSLFFLVKWLQIGCPGWKFPSRPPGRICSRSQSP